MSKYPKTQLVLARTWQYTRWATAKTLEYSAVALAGVGLCLLWLAERVSANGCGRW